MTNLRYSYDRPQRAFHWIMAATIFVAFALGLWAWSLPPKTPLRVNLLFAHKSLGMLTLVLLPLRVAYRVAVGEPAFRIPLDRLAKGASHAAHGLLYLLMLVLPVSGYVMSGAGGHPIPFFGLFNWPALVAQDKELSQSASGMHFWAAWAFVAILALHLAAVVWHERVKRDGVLQRMTRDDVGQASAG